MGKIQEITIRKKIEELGLEDEMIVVKHNNSNRAMQMDLLLSIIESGSPEEQEIITAEFNKVSDKKGGPKRFMKNIVKSLF